jgi:hypothetical protein
MVMYRHGIPLIPAEELGYHLGLTVPLEDAAILYKARVSETPPSDAGYGTQISNPEFEPNTVFKRLGIPLGFRQTLADKIDGPDSLLLQLQSIEQSDADALLCFNHGVIRGGYAPHSGHVVVFDRIIGNRIRIIDASWKHPKWRFVEAALLFEAIKRHGNDNAGGIWHLSHKPE